MSDYKELIDNLKYLSDAVKYPLVNELHAGSLMEDAANAIEQLVKERDAAVADISWLIIRPREVCKLCKHDFETAAGKCLSCSDITTYGNFEWRGVQDETD